MSKAIYSQKHMILSDKIFIEQALANHQSFQNIAVVLKKDHSTITKKSANTGCFRKASTTILKTTVIFFLPASIFGYIMESFAMICTNAAQPGTTRSING